MRAYVLREIQQQPGEKLADYCLKFQQKALEAGCLKSEDLVLAFIQSLLEQYRTQAFFLVTTRFETGVTDDLEKVINIVLAGVGSNPAGDTTANFKPNSRKRYNGANHSYHGQQEKKYKSSNKTCNYCNGAWFHKHQCAEFFVAHGKPVPEHLQRREKALTRKRSSLVPPHPLYDQAQALIQMIRKRCPTVWMTWSLSKSQSKCLCARAASARHTEKETKQNAYFVPVTL